MTRKHGIRAATAALAAVLLSTPSAEAQARAPATPSPIERFTALPPDRQESLRDQVQPLFFQSMQANGRLIRMAQDCGLPLPAEATPAARLEADLQNPDSVTGKLFGASRQGALLARLRGAMQATIDCGQAAEMRPGFIQQLHDFPRDLQATLDRGLPSLPGSAPALKAPALGEMRAAPVPGTTPGSAAVTARDLPRLMIGAPGTCELSTGGRPQPCISGLIYVQSQEGPILLSVQSAPTITIGFQGNSDSQPRPEHYTLNLTRLHTSVDRQTAAKSVTGTCEIDMSADGQTWQRAACSARDGNGLETRMTFTGNGRPVTTTRPGDLEGPAPAPRQ